VPCRLLPFFDGIAATPLVRRGVDEFLHPTVDVQGEVTTRHTFFAVYREMLLQIARDYPGLPDVRTLRASSIRFFFEGLRGDLHQTTKPK
jgi:hypothetical protein